MSNVPPKAPPRPTAQKASSPYMGVSIDEKTIHDTLIITPDISTEMAKQAALFSRYAIAAVWAKDKLERLKTALSILEAELDTAARTELTQAGAKIREASVEAIIHQNPKWQASNNQVLEARKELGILEAAATAFQQRAMMLSGLGAITRTEMEQELAGYTKTRAEKASAAVNKSFNDAATKNSGGW